MNRLLEIGFEPAGHWLLNSGKLTFELSRHASQKNILYAFVSDGEVKYVGKTVRSLYERMGGYKNPGTSQVTNVRNNERIRELLQSGAAVDILALPDNGLLHYGQFHLNLAAGLEDSLISVIAPQWKRSTTTSGSGSPVKDFKQSDTEPRPELDSGNCASTLALKDAKSSQFPKPITSFPLVVQKTYYNQGFFNVGISYTGLFGSDGLQIEIYCGTADQPIVGTINRTANTNQTPRIMGGKGLRDWFNRNMRAMQEATVAVLSPTAIRIGLHEAASAGVL